MKPAMILFLFLLILSAIIWLYIRHNNYRIFFYEKEYQRQLDYLRHAQQSAEYLHMLQHDVQNHFLTIKALAERGEQQKALGHIAMLQADINKKRDEIKSLSSTTKEMQL